MAQDAIRCDLCLNTVNIRCQTCNGNLCNGCVGNHISSQGSLVHDVISYKYKNQASKGPVPPSCLFHDGEKCGRYCTQCNIFFCELCLERHDKHETTDISTYCNSKEATIKREKAELENVLCLKYKSVLCDLKKKEADLTIQYRASWETVSKQSKGWHKEVNTIMDALSSELNQIQVNEKVNLKKVLNEIKKLVSRINTTVKESKEKLKFKEENKLLIVSQASKFEEPLMISQASKFEEVDFFSDDELNHDSLLSLQMETEQLQRQFGVLESSLLEANQLLNQTEFITFRACEYSKILSVCCIENEEAWLSGHDKVIKRINVRGKFLEYFTAKNCVLSLALTAHGEVLYTDAREREIYLLKDGVSKLLIRINGWHPQGMCTTSENDLLVCLQCDDGQQSKVVRFSGSSMTQEIQYDLSRNALYGTGKQLMMICENKNKDICVADSNARAVVVTDRYGIFRFKYDIDSTPKKYKAFLPLDVNADAMWNILVADAINNCIHIVSMNGLFTSYIDTCNISFPVGVSVDAEDKMWVIEGDTAQLKVIKYMK